MFHRRSLSSLVVLAVALALPPEGLPATSDDTRGESSEKLFQAYTQFYFARRDFQFAVEMSLREGYLAWLYEGINREVGDRSDEDPAGALEAISPPELQGFDEESYAFPDSLYDAPPRIRFVEWEKYQRTEFNHKFLQARLIKDRLIRTSTPEQRKRMFRADLESTIITYRDGDFRDAILRFDELMESYGFSDLADIAYFRAESYLAIQLYDQARADYAYVVDHSTEKWYRLRSLERLIALEGDRGLVEGVDKFWKMYESEATNRDAEFWATADAAGRYLLASGQWEAARNIFDMVPKDSPSYHSSTLRAADCQTALLNLDDASARYHALLIVPKGAKAPPDDFAAEANLKLAYIDYLRGDYDQAYPKFISIEAEGDVGERAEIGAIWALYRLSAYSQVSARAERFIVENPQSQYLYEARCLIGFANEMIGQSGGALDYYKIVMSALDDRQDFHDFNYELKAITENLGRLQQLEEAIFLHGESDLFEEYLHVRKILNGLMDNVRFARSLKATPLLKEIIKEQKELYALFAEQQGLESAILESQDTKLFDQYQKTVGDLASIGGELSAGVKFYMKQKTLIQREEDRRFEALMSDSIQSQLDREWKATQQAMALVRQYLDAPEEGDAASLVDMAGVEIQLAGIQDNILRIKRDLRKYGQDAVTSNLDEWSDFAYQRYTYGGLNFDYLYARENRLEELDEYIQQVNSMLQEREKARADTSLLEPSLVLVSKPGEKHYMAPAVPLWGAAPPKPVELAPPADTSAAAEPAPAVEEVIEIPAEAPAAGAPAEEVAPAESEATPPANEPGGAAPADTPDAPPEETPPAETGTPTPPSPENSGDGGPEPSQNEPTVP